MKVNGATVADYVYDAQDRLRRIDDPQAQTTLRTYTYDLAGRPTQIVDTQTGATSMTWNADSRMTSLTRGGQTQTFTYNAFGARMGQSGAFGSFSYQRDGASVVAPVLSDGAARYLPGISERRSGASTFFHDSLKNAGVQTNPSSAVSATRHYDAWGNVVSSTGTWQSPFGYAGRFGYQGDPTGFKLLGHRYYDPTVGRFLTRDPIKDGRNWYAYCANSPLIHADPDGLLV